MVVERKETIRPCIAGAPEWFDREAILVSKPRSAAGAYR
jgi:hypothetical protein